VLFLALLQPPIAIHLGVLLPRKFLIFLASLAKGWIFGIRARLTAYGFLPVDWPLRNEVAGIIAGQQKLRMTRGLFESHGGTAHESVVVTGNDGKILKRTD